MIKCALDPTCSCLTEFVSPTAIERRSCFTVTCLSFHFISLWTFSGRSDVASSLTPSVWCIVGGGGEEAQSLLGVQLSGASESNLLRQLRQLHGAPALAPTRCQGTVRIVHKCQQKKRGEHKHMLPGTTQRSAAVCSTCMKLKVRRRRFHKGGPTPAQISPPTSTLFRPMLFKNKRLGVFKVIDTARGFCSFELKWATARKPLI